MTAAAPTGRHSVPPPSPAPEAVYRRRRRAALAVLVVLLVLVLGLLDMGRSLAAALTRPGSDSSAARLAEWGRDHHLGAAVNWLEQLSYTPPKVGGVLAPDSPLTHGAGGARTLTARRGAPRPGPGPSVPAALTPFASPAIGGEGTWSPLATVHGQAALAAAFLRPDAVHTSYTAGVVWWNPRLLRAALHPGTLDPGGSGWQQRSDLPPGGRAKVIAAFNSGFRLASSLGGYYADGKTVRPLRPGAASMVFRQNGTLTIGSWSTEVAMTRDVTAVRQNLALLVDNGAVAPDVGDNAGHRWGATVGAAKYVWRSGIGVRADGSLIYVAGDRLSASTLAHLLLRAGCMRAMELDINRDWTSFVRYTAAGPANLLPDMYATPHRYDTPSSRDFISLSRP